MFTDNISVREDCRWADQEILHSKISSKSWPLAVKSPAQSLDCRANSYHIHLNTLGFHGYGEEISQNCPCPLCLINTFFSGTLPPSCHSASSNPPSWRRHCSRNSRTPVSPNSCSNRRSLGRKMAINFTVPKVHLLHLLFLVVLLSSANLFTEYVLSLFSLFLFFQPLNLLGIGW